MAKPKCRYFTDVALGASYVSLYMKLKLGLGLRVAVNVALHSD